MATPTPRRDDLHEGDQPESPFVDTQNPNDNDRGMHSNDTSPLSQDEHDPTTKNATGNTPSSYNYGNPRAGRALNSSSTAGRRGGASSNTGGKDSSDAIGRRELGEQEKSAGSGASNNTGAGEEAYFNKKGSAGRFNYKNEGSSNFTSFGSKLKITRRRAAFFIVSGVVGGGGIFGLSILQGPFQAVHLSQILQKNNFGNEKSSASRLQGFWRYHKTGDVGQTRVGYLGSRTFGKVTDRLKGIGVEFERNKFTGHPTKLTIDPSKHPSTKGLSPSKQAAALDKLYDVGKGSFARAGPGALSIDINSTTPKGIKIAGTLVQTSLEPLGDGKIATATNARAMKTFFNLPKLFSPISKRVNAAENKAGAAAATREEKKKADEERRKQLRDPVTEKGVAARSKIKENLNGNKAKIGAVLIGLQGLCIVRSVADSAVTVNRSMIVAPATIEAVDKTAVGSQSQSGLDLTLEQIGTVVQGFEDENGKTIFKAKALQATSGKGKPSGEDIGDDYKQAFSNETTAKNIKDTVGSFEIAGQDIGGLACSKPGLAIQGGIGIGLLIASVGGTPFTGGASLAAFTAKQGAQAAASFGVIYMLQNQFEKLLSDDEVLPATLSGPVGGNLLAYGAREASNINARSSGGVELGDTETAALDREQQLNSQKEFQSRGFASRLFDVYDYRSVASGLLEGASTDPAQNLTTLASSVMNIGQTIPNLFSSFTPKVTAAEEPYDWGFPRYGISKDILDDPSLQDPYDNADKVAAFLDSGDSSYIDRAKKCFGVDISKGADGWDVSAQEDVNPNEEGYLGANCNDTSDTWKRIILFIFDTRLITSVACYDGDEEACEQIGIGDTSGSTGTPSDNSTATENPNIKKISPTLNGSSCNCEIDPKGITLHWWGNQYGEGISRLVSIFEGNGYSVQLGITSEGKVYQLTDKLTTQTSHAIGGNLTTIGIEIEGGPDQFGKEGIEKYPKKFDAVVATVQYLKDKYNMPIKKNPTCDNASGILQHSDFNGCPDAEAKSDIDDYYYNEVIKRVK